MKAIKLISQAQNLLNEFPPKYEKAGKLFNKAFKLEPMNSTVLSAYGEYMSTIGDFDKAEELLKRSIEINPEDDYVKYFNLAQILEGKDSLLIWKKGVELLINKLQELENCRIKKDSEKEDINLMKDQLCSAFCAISELYMTDLCDNDDAESEIQKYLTKSLQVNEAHFETLCCRLSYFKTVCNSDECKKGISEIKKLISKFKLINSDKNNYNDGFDKYHVQLPEYSVRLNLSRTLIDLNETELAEEVLNSLLSEDEEDWQVWYLFSWCNLVSNNIVGAIESFKLCKKYGTKYIEDIELRKRFRSDLENLKSNIKNTLQRSK